MNIKKSNKCFSQQGIFHPETNKQKTPPYSTCSFAAWGERAKIIGGNVVNSSSPKAETLRNITLNIHHRGCSGLWCTLYLNLEDKLSHLKGCKVFWKCFFAREVSVSQPVPTFNNKQEFPQMHILYLCTSTRV